MNPRPASTRLLLAIIAGLCAMVLALLLVVLNIAVDHAAVDAQEAEYQRIINQLTKRIYWLENGGDPQG